MLKKLNIFRILKEKLSTNQFLIVTAIIVGLSAGLMAVILKTIVHFIQRLFDTNVLFSPEKTPYYVIYPSVGIALTVFFVQRFFNGDLGKGVSNVLYEIAKKSAFVKRHKMYSHIVTSALTVGFGGSAGLEAPIVITGSAVGSNVATSFKLNYRERTLFLGCGAAAGIAAVFNSPIAGVMFAMEVLLAEVTVSSFIPLIISAACGALFTKIVFNEKELFFFRLQQPFDWHNTFYYVGLAFVCAFISLYYVKISHGISTYFKSLNINIWLKVAIGGILLAGLMYIFPSLFGEGYPTIRLLADGQTDDLLHKSIFKELRFDNASVIAFIAATILVKPLATSITLSSGGNGGNFAPSLFVGTHVGFVFAKFLNTVFDLKLPESNFTIVGMAGILSGVMYAPLTGIFLIAEVTGGYELIIPLMIVSTLSHFIVRQFEPYSLEVKDMVEKGEVFSRDKDRNILLLLKTDNLIETDIKTIAPNAPLSDLIHLIKDSKRNIFAVVSTEGVLSGILTLDDVRHVMFETQMYKTLKVKDLMHDPPAVIHINEDMNSVMKKFDNTRAWNLPVVDGEQYVGFISKSSVFSKYRNQLISMSNELE